MTTSPYPLPKSPPTMKVLESATVKSMKSSLHEAHGTEEARDYIRLIVSGRMMKPDSGVVGDFLKDGDVVRVVYAKAREVKGEQYRESVGCSSSKRRTPGGGTGEDGDVELGEGSGGGFDALRVALTRDEISAIRSHFGPMLPPPPGGDSESDDREERYRREEEFMMSQGPGSELAVNLGGRVRIIDGRVTAVSGVPNPSPSSIDVEDDAGGAYDHYAPYHRSSGVASSSTGTTRDFLYGVMLGFFVGFFLMFWIWMPSVTYRQKLGILTGIGIQILFNLSEV